MSRRASIFIATLLVAACLCGSLRAQNQEGTREEITVQFTVPDVGSFMMPAVIDGATLYLPVGDLFASLRIRMDTLAAGSVITGIIADERRAYRIDPMERTITFDGEQTAIGTDGMFSSEGALYLRSDLFGSIFGLHCDFDFRGLEVRLRTDFELPAVRDMRRERAHRMLHRGVEEPAYDERINATHALMRAGVADWSVDAGMDASGHRSAGYTFGLGGEVADGVLEASVHGTGDSLPALRNVQWNWRYVDDDFAPARQITIGDIGTTLPDPFRGNTLALRVTNASTMHRSNYGVYVIQDHTEPGWGVELYAEGRLVDYALADSNGLYRFEFPINYGATMVQLRFYGPWGEERSYERTVRIPHTFLPSGDVEYTVVGGLLQRTGSQHREPFANASATVGIGSVLTIGGGTYIGSDADAGWIFPYVQASMRPADWLLLSGEYTRDLGGSVSLSLVPGARTSLELGYTRRRTSLDPTSSEEVRKGTLDFSTPLDLPLFNGALSLRLVDDMSGGMHDISQQSTITTHILGAPLTVDTRGEWFGRSTFTTMDLRSEARIALDPFGCIGLRPMVEYDWRMHRISGYGIDLGRQIVQGLQAELTLARDPVAHHTSAQFTLQFDLPFARTTLGANSQDGAFATHAVTSGAVALDDADYSIVPSGRGQIDRASIAIRPFLDLNNNDRRDDGEPLVAGLDVFSNAGTVHRSSDSLVRILDLEPYAPAVITVDDGHLANVSWRAKYRTLEVFPEADHVQSIDLPVVIAGEVSGHVVRVRGGKRAGMSGIIVRFGRADGSVADSVITQDGGEYYFTGLPPGDYTVTPDADQMRLLHLESISAAKPFTLRAGADGDSVDGVDMEIGDATRR